MSNLKKKLIIASLCFCGITYFNIYNNNVDTSISLSDIAIIQSAMAEGSSSGNTGPASEHECGGGVAGTCNYNEKWCDCENDHSCTEKLCPKHS